VNLGVGTHLFAEINDVARFLPRQLFFVVSACVRRTVDMKDTNFVLADVSNGMFLRILFCEQSEFMQNSARAVACSMFSTQGVPDVEGVISLNSG